METERFAPIPYAGWVDTKNTLHHFAQVVGKVRLAAGVRRNHWWGVPFHLTGRGITTRPMGDERIFTIDFDFVDHRLSVHPGGRDRVLLPGRTVGGLVLGSGDRRPGRTSRSTSIGPPPSTWPTPVDPSPRTPSTRPTTRAG